MCLPEAGFAVCYCVLCGYCSGVNIKINKLAWKHFHQSLVCAQVALRVFKITMWSSHANFKNKVIFSWVWIPCLTKPDKQQCSAHITRQCLAWQISISFWYVSVKGQFYMLWIWIPPTDKTFNVWGWSWLLARNTKYMLWNKAKITEWKFLRTKLVLSVRWRRQDSSNCVRTLPDD